MLWGYSVMNEDTYLDGKSFHEGVTVKYFEKDPVTNNLYLVKATRPQLRDDMSASYINNCISEHLGSKIYSSLGIEAQETELSYTGNEFRVRCKLFALPNTILHASDVSCILQEEHRNRRNDFNITLKELKKHNAILFEQAEKLFWNMVVVDAFISNTDRHNHNWGFLKNDEGVYTPAPIFDCGSSLFPFLSEREIDIALHDKKVMDSLILKEKSAITQQGRKISHKILINLNHPRLEESILELVPRIDFNKIDPVIDSIPHISNIKKDFYKRILDRTLEIVLEPRLKELMKARNY